MLSTSGNRNAVYISLLAVFIALFGSGVTLITGHVERGRIEATARTAEITAKKTDELAKKTNDGLICLLQRAILNVQENPGGRTDKEVVRIINYYDREIKLLGGYRECDGARG